MYKDIAKKIIESIDGTEIKVEYQPGNICIWFHGVLPLKYVVFYKDSTSREMLDTMNQVYREIKAYREQYTKGNDL